MRLDQTYPGRHSVSYRGFREGKGIWGTWELGAYRGGFHIWPLSFGGLAQRREEHETVVAPFAGAASLPGRVA